MNLATTVATAIEKINDLMDLVKGQYSKWDGQVKAKIAELESWKVGFVSNTYRMDFRVSKQGYILKILATPWTGNVALRYDLAKFQSQKDWGFNQAFIRVRKSYHFPTSESIYRIDNYYDGCTLKLVQDGGCNILKLDDNGEVGITENGKSIYQWVLYADLAVFSGYNIELDFVMYSPITDYRNPLGNVTSGVELLSNIKTKV